MEVVFSNLIVWANSWGHPANKTHVPWPRWNLPLLRERVKITGNDNTTPPTDTGRLHLLSQEPANVFCKGPESQ